MIEKEENRTLNEYKGEVYFAFAGFVLLFIALWEMGRLDIICNAGYTGEEVADALLIMARAEYS